MHWNLQQSIRTLRSVRYARARSGIRKKERPLGKFLEKATNLIFWTSLVLSLINVIAGVFGATLAVNWLFGTELPAILLTPVAIFAWGSLLISWVNTAFANAAGMVIYAANVFAGPFFYDFLGIPYTIGLLIAALPFALYFWAQRVIDLVDSVIRR